MAVTDALEQVDGSTLCMQCGLCCDGSLFNRMLVTQSEVSLAEAGDLRVFEKDGRLHASQPCSYLKARVCSIYATRFATCRGFRCKLLEAVQQGREGIGGAIDRVAEARRLLHAATVAATAAGLPHVPSDTRAIAADWRAVADPGAKRLMATAQLAIVALETYLNRYFRGPPKRRKA